MKHKISLPRRVAAFALAFLLVLPNAYAAAGEQKLQTSTQIAQGLTYRNTVTVNDGSRVESVLWRAFPSSCRRTARSAPSCGRAPRRFIPAPPSTGPSPPPRPPATTWWAA